MTGEEGKAGATLGQAGEARGKKGQRLAKKLEGERQTGAEGSVITREHSPQYLE